MMLRSQSQQLENVGNFSIPNCLSPLDLNASLRKSDVVFVQIANLSAEKSTVKFCRFCFLAYHAHALLGQPKLPNLEGRHTHAQSNPQKVALRAASFVDACVAAVQVEEFGLPKSGVSTAHQRSFFYDLTFDV